MIKGYKITAGAFAALICMAAPQSFAQTANDDFGQPFANVEHPGFEDPATDVDQTDMVMDGTDLQGIEPAAGTETEAAADTGAAEAAEASVEAENSGIEYIEPAAGVEADPTDNSGTDAQAVETMTEDSVTEETGE